VSSASPGVRGGYGQAAAAWSVRRGQWLPVQLRDGADRLRQHRLAVAGPRTAWTANQPHPARLRHRIYVGRLVVVSGGGT